MKLIKLLFWLCTAIILAYFMTDLKVGGRTIKGTIDRYIHFDGGLTLREKVGQWLGNNAAKIPVTIESHDPSHPPVTEEAGPPSDDIRQGDEEKLKKVINKNE